MPRRFFTLDVFTKRRSRAIRSRSCSMPRGSIPSACRPSPTSSTSPRPFSSAAGRRGPARGFADLHAEAGASLRGPSDRRDGGAARAHRSERRAGRRLVRARGEGGDRLLCRRGLGKGRGCARFRAAAPAGDLGRGARSGAGRLGPRSRASGDRLRPPPPVPPLRRRALRSRAGRFSRCPGPRQGLGRNLRRGIRRDHPSVRLCLCPRATAAFRARMFFQAPASPRTRRPAPLRRPSRAL